MRPSGYLGDGGVGEIGIERAHGRIELPGGHEMAGFPYGSAGVPWSDFPGIGPRVKAKNIRCQRRSDMHGAAVHADDPPRPADQPDQFREGRLVEEVLGIGREG